MYEQYDYHHYFQSLKPYLIFQSINTIFTVSITEFFIVNLCLHDLFSPLIESMYQFNNFGTLLFGISQFLKFVSLHAFFYKKVRIRLIDKNFLKQTMILSIESFLRLS